MEFNGSREGFGIGKNIEIKYVDCSFGDLIEFREYLPCLFDRVEFLFRNMDFTISKLA